MNPQLAYLLAIHRGINITFPRFKELQKHFNNNWEAVFKSSFKEIESLNLDVHAKRKWHKLKDQNPEKEMEKLLKSKAQAVIYGDPNYPTALLTIPSPPVILFYKGSSLHHNLNLAIVGSRKISLYSKNVIDQIIPPLIKEDIQIVSGLALGVDKYAHQQALKNKGKTLAVLGCGIDTIYPVAHTSLAKEILESGGTIVSEFLPGTEARPENFPIRNRIVSGLSKGVLVVQANQKSGSIITAHQGLEQGKEIMTIPGSVFQEGSAGCHNLIKKGEAALITNSEDIFNILNVIPNKKAINQNILSKEEREILKLFQNQQNLPLEEIIKRIQKPKNLIISTLMLLEMKNIIHLSQNHEYEVNPQR